MAFEDLVWDNDIHVDTGHKRVLILVMAAAQIITGSDCQRRRPWQAVPPEPLGIAIPCRQKVMHDMVDAK